MRELESKVKTLGAGMRFSLPEPTLTLLSRLAFHMLKTAWRLSPEEQAICQQSLLYAELKNTGQR